MIEIVVQRRWPRRCSPSGFGIVLGVVVMLDVGVWHQARRCCGLASLALALLVVGVPHRSQRFRLARRWGPAS